MNIGRGLLRLWIVASVTWLVAGVSLLQPWEDVQRVRTDYRRDVLASEQGVLAAEALVRAGEEHLSRASGATEVAEAEEKLKLWKARLLANQLLSDGLRASSPDVLGALAFPLMCLLLPPLVALLLGAALFWAMRGFRRDAA